MTAHIRMDYYNPVVKPPGNRLGATERFFRAFWPCLVPNLALDNILVLVVRHHSLQPSEHDVLCLILARGDCALLIEVERGDLSIPVWKVMQDELVANQEKVVHYLRGGLNT